MPTRFPALACLLAFGPLATADILPPDRDFAVHTEDIRGAWMLVDKELNGRRFPENSASPWVTIQRDLQRDLLMTIEEIQPSQFRIKLDPSKTPRAIDMVPIDRSQGRPTKLGIYRLNGNRLTLCWSNAGERPATFATKPDAPVVLWILERKSER